MALHLYIPPHACHIPGCFSGLIRGMVLRKYRLCSKRTDRTFWLKEFYGHMLGRGYHDSLILSAFKPAVKKCHLLHIHKQRIPHSAKKHFNISQEHLVPSFEIQSCWSLFQAKTKTLEISGGLPRQQTTSPLSYEKRHWRKDKSFQIDYILPTADILTLATFFLTAKFVTDGGWKCHPSWIM